ncbi:TRAP transporter large permease [Pelagibius sp. Alg239-R121]|uniref:TRAP transporter large permease n=1 Tax=Pelagibius sp. Alg239-R121 TaxID=2993448 RepID=UPI0024A65BEA|nr:TRAP transporter large permease subunit [Pelagibius sp. Alg239-R121]
MEEVFFAIAVFLFLAFYLGVGTWIFIAILMVGLTSLLVVLDFPLVRVGSIMKGTMWRTASTWELAAIPMFVFMGEIMFRTDVSNRLFRGLSPWTNLIPGKLLHCNVVGCTLFAAVSGSSTATTATVGKITMTELDRRGYDSNLVTGSLAGAGSLGLMIPPSISMIIYGVLAEQSITGLFAAGILPGLLISALYSAYIVYRALTGDVTGHLDDTRYSVMDYLRSLLDLAPILVLMFVVLGGIYTGIVTPSEAAALGFAASILMVTVLGQFSWKVFLDALTGATRITCMVVTILVAASFMSSTMAYMHVPQEVAKLIAAMHLGPVGIIVLIGVFYVILGMFLDGLSIMVMTLPITLPIVVAAGWDPIWFGIFLVIMIELGLITPPIGFNLFVLQGITAKPIGQIAYSAFPFFLLMLLAAVIIAIFPQIALWLPSVIL